MLHDGPLFRFVGGADASYADFTQPGALGALLAGRLARPWTLQDAEAQNARTAARYSWDALLPQYVQMLEIARTLRNRPSAHAASLQ
jgi:hypothetical protein